MIHTQFITLILNNFTILSLTVGLGIIIISTKNFDRKTNILFSLLIVVVIALISESIADSCCSHLSSPNFWRYLISAMGYTLRPCFIVLLINIVLRREKTSLLLWVPLIILAIIAFTDYFTHLMFSYSENNAFGRGPLTYLAHIVSALYLLIFLLLIIKRRNNITHSEIFVIAFSSFICFFATVLETILFDCKNLITGAMAVSSALYYIVLYAETFRRDFLTGLLNRKSLYINMKKKTHKTLVVISVDLNCLKEINDTYGHIAGDKALKNLANILLEESKNDYIPYRTGGDEFILIGKEQTNKDIHSFFDRIRSKLKEKNIMASFGYALYKPYDRFDDVCNLADSYMYKDKRHYRSRSNI